MATAFFWPTNTTSPLVLVRPFLRIEDGDLGTDPAR
jgi:hypothetical protein